ncbi:MAG: DUF3313 family protein [Pseudomonadota bacterium]
MNAKPHLALPGTALRLTLCALLVTFAAAALAADAPASEGLIPVKARSFDKAWRSPEANLKAYTGVLIRPVTVAFSKNWRPRDYGSFGLKSEDVERIRSTYTKIADESFARVLSEGGYSIASAPGENVLEIQLEVTDLYVNGPDFDSDVLVRTYVRDFGDMRLLITLRDSASGATLFRSDDFKRGDETGRLEWANSVYNRSEAERSLTDWAHQLKRMLAE